MPTGACAPLARSLCLTGLLVKTCAAEKQVTTIQVWSNVAPRPRSSRSGRRTRSSAGAARVHCDKIVYPAACIDRACPFVYAYEEFGHTYIGCMQKVYDVEIDLDLLREAERRRGGFGAIRSTRQPLPMCRVEVEETLPRSRGDELGCVNPEFSELPRRPPDASGFSRQRSATPRPAGVQLAQLRHLRCVRAVVVGAGNLQHRGQSLKLRVREEDAEPLAHQALERRSRAGRGSSRAAPARR